MLRRSFQGLRSPLWGGLILFHQRISQDLPPLGVNEERLRLHRERVIPGAVLSQKPQIGDLSLPACLEKRQFVSVTQYDVINVKAYILPIRAFQICNIEILHIVLHPGIYRGPETRNGGSRASRIFRAGKKQEGNRPNTDEHQGARTKRPANRQCARFQGSPALWQIVASGGTATPHSAHFFTTITRYDNFWRQAAQALKKGAVQNDLELGNLDDARG